MSNSASANRLRVINPYRSETSHEIPDQPGEEQPLPFNSPATRGNPHHSPIRRSAGDVFGAWLDPEIAGQWLFATASHPMTHVEINARVEGAFRFAEQRDGEVLEYTGEYIEIVPHRRLAFTLSMEDHWYVVTRVMVEIAALKTGCELTLVHEDVPSHYADYTEARWTGILYGLAVTLASRSLTQVERIERRHSQ